MAFDGNSLPKDLRPLNVARTLADDVRIAPPSTSGRAPDTFYHSPNNVSSPVYYTDASGLPGLSYLNPTGVVPGWTARMPSPVSQLPISTAAPSAYVHHPTSSIASSGYSYSPNYAVRPGGNGTPTPTVTPSDHNASASEEGVDESVSGRKVKFLCSFGGKILPRPSDGTLRYVGGQTRIISFRRNVTFPDLVRKMVETCGQPVTIKYQLPYEDLDALVSVSCPDDLDNMMEEYQKLLETSPDGSVKLRVFLFSATELDPTGLVQFGDMQDSGHRYVDAVNGIVDGFSGGMTRKESIASVASTQNSDMSGTDLLDAVVGQDVTPPTSNNMFSPRSDSSLPNDNAPRFETSAPPLIVPASNPGDIPFQAHGPPELQRYDLHQTGANFPPPPSSYLTGYVDPQRDPFSHVSPHVVYANPQVLGAPRPVLMQPQYRDGVTTMMTQQYVPAVQMTVAPPTSHLSVNPNIVHPIVQPQRVVAVTDQSYNNAYSPQVGGGYGWHQVQSQDHVPYSDGWMPHQHVVPMSADCYMCQKALPHAHSDSIVQDQKDNSHTTTDKSPNYQSLRCDDISRIHALAPTGGAGLTGDVQTPYGGAMGTVPASHPEDALHHLLVASSQPTQELLVNKPNGELKTDVFVQGELHNLERDTLPNVPFTQPTPVSIVDPFGLELNTPVVQMISRENDPPQPIVSTVNVVRDDATPFTGGETTTTNNNVKSIVSPHELAPNESLFIDQDPWNMRPEVHYPPPKPTKITMRRESSAKELHGADNNVNLDSQFSDGVKPTSEQVQTTKGSAEDSIKQQLQAIAEGVAASVLHSSVQSIADFTSQQMSVSVSETGHEMDGQNSEAHVQSKMEAMNIKPEKANFGFPMSDGMGRLQIIKNDDLEELRELGSGTFGTVYHGKWRGTDVAIKRINDRCFAGKASEQERMRDDFWNEAIKLADLHHPNVVAFYGVVLDGPGGSVATVTEYMVNGSLRTALQKNERNLDKRKRLLIAMDVAFGMEYLHSKNIVHFDLKSDNLLVNLRDPHRPICKVGDLGLSKVKCQTLISGGVRGTLPWMAPELLNGSSSLVSEKVDVFSFGIVLWELLTGAEPYADLHYGAIIGGIVSNTLRPAVPENCDPDWRNLMEKCWSAEPSERLNFTEIANELRAMASKVPPKGQTPATTTKTNV